MRNHLSQTLMDEFADSISVSGTLSPRRYLWTDAFAVCNFLSLRRQTGDERYLAFARELVDQVHHILGRHRADHPRRGWISGLLELPYQHIVGCEIENVAMRGLKFAHDVAKQLVSDLQDCRFKLPSIEMLC